MLERPRKAADEQSQQNKEGSALGEFCGFLSPSFAREEPVLKRPALKKYGLVRPDFSLKDLPPTQRSSL